MDIERLMISTTNCALIMTLAVQKGEAWSVFEFRSHILTATLRADRVCEPRVQLAFFALTAAF